VKVEPKQVQVKILEDIRVLEHPLSALEPIQPRLIFENYRRGPGTGLRLTPYGMRTCKKLYDHATVTLTSKPTSKELTILDKCLFWPYYINKKEITLFSETDAFDIKLYDGDIGAWCKGKKLV
jgi:hypothetical protein